MKKLALFLSAFILILMGVSIFPVSGIECGQEEPAAKLLGEWFVAGKYGATPKKTHRMTRKK
jgi:hypothetical protein